MKTSLLLLIWCLCAARSSEATIAFSSPLASNTYDNTLPFSISFTTAANAVFATFTCIGGTCYPEYPEAHFVLYFSMSLFQNNVGSFYISIMNFSPATVVSTVPAGMTSLVDGTYQISMAYVQASNNITSSSSLISNVQLTSHTWPATVTLPVAGSTYATTIPFSFYLPDSPTLYADGIYVSFTPANESVAVATLYCTYSYQTQAFTVNGNNLPASVTAPYLVGIATGSVHSLASGLYNISICYSDIFNHPFACSTVEIAYLIAYPVTTANVVLPQSNSVYNSSTGIAFFAIASLAPQSMVVVFYMSNTSIVFATLFVNGSTITYQPPGDYLAYFSFPSTCSVPYTSSFPLGCSSAVNGLAYGTYDISVTYYNTFGVAGVSPLITNVSYTLDPPVCPGIAPEYITNSNSSNCSSSSSNSSSSSCPSCPSCSDTTTIAGLAWYFWFTSLICGTLLVSVPLTWYLTRSYSHPKNKTQRKRVQGFS